MLAKYVECFALCEMLAKIILEFSSSAFRTLVTTNIFEHNYRTHIFRFKKKVLERKVVQYLPTNLLHLQI